MLLFLIPVHNAKMMNKKEQSIRHPFFPYRMKFLIVQSPCKYIQGATPHSLPAKLHHEMARKKFSQSYPYFPCSEECKARFGVIGGSSSAENVRLLINEGQDRKSVV